jgi:hypothetical protein
MQPMRSIPQLQVYRSVAGFLLCPTIQTPSMVFARGREAGWDCHFEQGHTLLHLLAPKHTDRQMYRMPVPVKL